jgi:hypothetical protein
MIQTADSVTGIDIPGFDSQRIRSDVQIFKSALVGVDTGLFYSFAEAIKMDNNHWHPCCIYHREPSVIIIKINRRLSLLKVNIF